jgi:hypothetical protein
MDDDFDARMQPYVSRIGRVAAGWARLEYLTNEIIWHLANVEYEFGACITAQIMSPSNRVRALISLVRLRGGKEPLLAELNKFSVAADGLARRRNRVVHDPWLIGPDQTHRVEITADKRLTFEAKETTLAEIEAIALAIKDTIARLIELYDRIKSELPPWPDTQFQQSLDRHPVRAILVD